MTTYVKIIEIGEGVHKVHNYKKILSQKYRMEHQISFSSEHTRFLFPDLKI